MNKIYIVKKVFEDKDDVRNRYPVNSIVSFDDEERVNDLLERGIIKELSLSDQNEKDQIKESKETIIDNENKCNKNKKKGDK